MTDTDKNDAPAPLTAAEAAAELAFPDSEYTSAGVNSAFRSTYVQGYSAGAEAAAAEIAELQARLRHVLTAIDSFSWDRRNESFVAAVREYALPARTGKLTAKGSQIPGA